MDDQSHFLTAHHYATISASLERKFWVSWIESELSMEGERLEGPGGFPGNKALSEHTRELHHWETLFKH